MRKDLEAIEVHCTYRRSYRDEVVNVDGRSGEYNQNGQPQSEANQARAASNIFEVEPQHRSIDREEETRLMTNDKGVSLFRETSSRACPSLAFSHACMHMA